MSLIDSMMEPCVMVDKKTVADGLGGFTTQWVDGAEFNAAIVIDSSTEAKIAEKQGVTELYTITVQKGMPLAYHDVFKRVRDSQVFRVTSNIKDKQSPDVASFSIGQVSAERWELR